jgi:hypothetical protein
MLNLFAYFDDCYDGIRAKSGLWNCYDGLVCFSGTALACFDCVLCVYLSLRDVWILCDLWPYTWSRYRESYLFYSCHCNEWVL